MADPFDVILPLCRISASQERSLRRRRGFVGDDSGEESSLSFDGFSDEEEELTGIQICAPEDSSSSNVTDLEDECLTPPEERPGVSSEVEDPIVDDDGSCGDADTGLGRDAELVFSDGESVADEQGSLCGGDGGDGGGDEGVESESKVNAVEAGLGVGFGGRERGVSVRASEGCGLGDLVVDLVMDDVGGSSMQGKERSLNSLNVDFSDSAVKTLLGLQTSDASPVIPPQSVDPVKLPPKDSSVLRKLPNLIDETAKTAVGSSSQVHKTTGLEAQVQGQGSGTKAMEEDGLNGGGNATAVEALIAENPLQSFSDVMDGFCEEDD